VLDEKTPPVWRDVAVDISSSSPVVHIAFASDIFLLTVFFFKFVHSFRVCLSFAFFALRFVCAVKDLLTYLICWFAYLLAYLITDSGFPVDTERSAFRHDGFSCLA